MMYSVVLVMYPDAVVVPLISQLTGRPPLDLRAAHSKRVVENVKNKCFVVRAQIRQMYLTLLGSREN